MTIYTVLEPDVPIFERFHLQGTELAGHLGGIGTLGMYHLTVGPILPFRRSLFRRRKLCHIPLPARRSCTHVKCWVFKITTLLSVASLDTDTTRSYLSRTFCLRPNTFYALTKASKLVELNSARGGGEVQRFLHSCF